MSSYLPSWFKNPFTSSTPPSADTTATTPAPAAPAPAPGGSSYFPSFGGLFGSRTPTPAPAQPAAMGGRHRTYRKKSKSKRRRAGRKSTRR